MSQGCYSGEFSFEADDEEPQPKTRLSGPRYIQEPVGTPAADQQHQQQPQQHPPPPAPSPPPPLSPPPPPLGAPRRQLYIQSARLAQLSAQLPVNKDRSTLVHSLASAYSLTTGNAAVDVAEAQPASLEQMQDYHSREYLSALALHAKLSERQRAAYGLEDDCAPFPGLYEYAALCTGGSLQAAAGLCSRQYSLAVNLDGGRHHAAKSKAAGFCYANDVVLAIQQLLGSFRRVLYLDIDVHHGDAVEAAFLLTNRVLTISLHKHAPGFFPGTGARGVCGEGAGRGFALNLPLGDGTRDELFGRVLAELAGGAAAAFDPDCVVLQCGTDGLARDPIAGSWALTPAAYAACAELVASWGRPLLLLGGGGYDSAAAACTWAGVLAALLGEKLPDDIPEHEHLTAYGPGYTRSSVTRHLLPPDTNDAEAMLAACRQMVSELRSSVERVEGSGPAAAAHKRAKS